jgi:NADPH-dependent glutamate synthase beta subunit-like oxidoreductase/ferredoxin
MGFERATPEAGLASPPDPGHLAPPCRSACPTDKDIPGFLRAIARGDPAAAWRIAYRDNLFPGVLGWICPRPCELACRLGARGAPVPVCDLKRWLTSAHEPPPDLQPRPAGAGPAIAVIGAGPAGLAAAHDLAIAGARVTLFDRDERPGGLLTGCIPAFRLPPSVAESDIERILALGIRFKPRFVLEDTRQLDALRDEHGFTAMLLATGAGDDREPVVPGWRPTPMTRTAIALLRDIGEGRARMDGLRVAVVGGGNGAVDAARAALRVGAKEVDLLYRRGRDAMPAFRDAIAAAESEGVRIHARTLVTEIIWQGGTMRGVRCAHTDARDSDPRSTAPRPLPGTEYIRTCGAVVYATGQVPTLASDVGLAPGVFSCGDAPSGRGTVVDAIATGRRAAARMIESMTRAGTWDSGRPQEQRANSGGAVANGPGVTAAAPRDDLAMVSAARDGRLADTPGDPFLPPGSVTREAARCLACDHVLALDTEICILCGTCEDRCAYDALAWRPATNGTAGAWRLTILDTDCQRCGDCVVGCPSGALTWNPWTHPNRICTVQTITTASPAAAS